MPKVFVLRSLWYERLITYISGLLPPLLSMLIQCYHEEYVYTSLYYNISSGHKMFLPSILIIAGGTNRTVGHIRLPSRRNLCISREIAVRRKAHGQILLYTRTSDTCVSELLQEHDHGARKVV